MKGGRTPKSSTKLLIQRISHQTTICCLQMLCIDTNTQQKHGDCHRANCNEDRARNNWTAISFDVGFVDVADFCSLRGAVRGHEQRGRNDFLLVLCACNDGCVVGWPPARDGVLLYWLMK